MSLGKIVYTESPLRLQTAQCTHSPVTSTLYRYGLFRVSKQEHVIPVFCLQPLPDISFASCDDTREVVGRERKGRGSQLDPLEHVLRKKSHRGSAITRTRLPRHLVATMCRMLQRVRNVKKSAARKDLKLAIQGHRGDDIGMFLSLHLKCDRSSMSAQSSSHGKQ